MIGKYSAYHPQLRFHDEAFTECNQAIPEYNDRELFYRLIGKEIRLNYLHAARDRLWETLKDLEKDPNQSIVLSDNPESLEAELADYSDTARASSVHKAGDLLDTVRQYAPTALTEAGWLQGVGNASIGHTDSAARLFDIYSRCQGFQSNRQRRPQLYRRALIDLDIQLPETQTYAFCKHPALFDSAFAAPLIQNSLSQFPNTFLPEIIGYTLAHVFGGSKILRSLQHLAKESKSAACTSLKVYLNSMQHAELRSTAIEAAAAFLRDIPKTQNPSAWSRLSRGIHLYSFAEKTLFDELQSVRKSNDPWHDQLLSLLESMAGLAHGHHRNITIGGKKLDDWFAGEQLDAGKLLRALLESEYFDRENPCNSRFFKQSTAFGGPMFGVFDARQLRLFREYLTRARTNTSLFQAQTRVSPKVTQTANPKPNKYPIRQSAGRESSVVRNLYFKLLNIESHPEVLPVARQFVSTQLRKSRSSLNSIRLTSLRYFDFEPTVFEAFIKQTHERETSRYRDFVPPPKLGKETYVWGIEQFAPTILVDGCWLQNISRGGFADNSITPRLFRIYADELGAGRSDWNHPNVYRKLLTSLDIHLPNFTSQEFAKRAGFLDAAFDIPVFLLAISQFPSSFLPELIGLNLAIELSGLGSTYMKLIDELKFWNIDPTIVSLHLSIDNLATGHAAIASEVVTLYLDEIRNNHGYNEMQACWKRIWTGYLSLRIVPKRFRNALAFHFLKNFVISPAYRRAWKLLSAGRNK